MTVLTSAAPTFPYVMENYAIIIYEFLLELYVFYALFSIGLTRKKYFAARVAVGLAVMLVAGYGAMTLYHFIGSTVWGRVLIYFALFALSVVHFRMCFDESLWTRISMVLNLHGRTCCKPKPLCTECPVSALCPSSGCATGQS